MSISFRANVSLRSFISADNGNKADQHAVRMNNVASAIDQAYRGNATYIIEAMAYARTLKTATGKAYVAGFVAMGTISRHDYKGKITPEIAKAISDKVEETAGLFSAAFAEICPIVDVVKTDDEKAKAKAEKEEKKAKEKEEIGKAYAAENGLVASAGLVAMTDMTAADVMNAFSFNLGKLSADQLAVIVAKASAALTEVRMNEETDKADEKAAAHNTPESLAVAKAYADKAAARRARNEEKKAAALATLPAAEEITA